ncbi:TD and POZ domain-containing protein 4-like [Uloborus diversus]|uniref:TD and POZ domain-containing protein 4-like n=1 Tax=Uloborus diversus TaxID=327109 RepID=UPI00240A9A39|nr:TD and POZ domain-containing protein 4-like [Uloborus diversus]
MSYRFTEDLLSADRFGYHVTHPRNLTEDMATRCIERESRMVSDSINFKWKLKNFTIDDLLVHDRCRLRSPPFKCFKAVFCLEFYLNSDFVNLKLIQRNNANPPWISDCVLGLTYSNKSNQHFEQFSAPIRGRRPEDIKWYFTLKTITNSAENILDIWCNFTASTLKQVEDDKSDEDEENVSNSSNSGPLIVVENIGQALEHCRLSDVTLKVGNVELQAHKIILASRSKVFDAMFDSRNCLPSEEQDPPPNKRLRSNKTAQNLKESHQDVVNIIEMKPSIAKEMLLYIYTGKIEKLSMDRAMDLYVAADRYDLQGLKEQCQCFIQKHVSVEDICQVAELAELHDDKKLAKVVRTVFKANSKSILVSKDWKGFAAKNPVLYSNLMEGALLSPS